MRDSEVHRIRNADHRADEAVVREADHDRSMQAKETEVMEAIYITAIVVVLGLLATLTIDE